MRLHLTAAGRVGLATGVVLAASAVPLLTAAPATAAPTSFPGRPNGRIVFDVDTNDGFDRIAAVNPDGSRFTFLTDAGHRDLGPDVSADGRSVVFSSDRSGSTQLWAMNADGTGVHQLTSDADGQALYPAWSPDGTSIAYRLMTASDVGDIAVIPATGGTPVRLTDTPGLDSLPEWSPDGTRIAFHSARDDADPAGCYAAGACVEAVYVMAADGSDQTRVAYDPGGEDRFPNWSPDGSTIIYEHWDSTDAAQPTHLWTVRPDGSGKALFAPAASYASASAPDYSPNGKQVVFNQYGDLFTVPVAGGPVRLIVPNDSLYALAPDWSTIPAVPQSATVTVTMSPSAPVWGQPVTFTAKVTGTGAVPTGTVTFSNGATTVGSAALSAKGVATLRVSSLEPFQGTLAAHYQGDATHDAAVGYVNGGVAQAATTTALSVTDGATLTYGDPVTVAVHTVRPSQGVVTGTGVDLAVDGSHTNLPVTRGTAKVPPPALPAGAHDVQACVGNTLEYTGSCSATVHLTVGQGTGALTLRASSTQVAPGRRVTLTAQLRPADAGVPVDITEGDTDLGTVLTDSGGVARLTIVPSGSGSHTYTATSAADANLTAATAAPVVVTVG